MHIPNPSMLVRPVRRAYCYFRSGVAVEGEAWLCADSHGPFFAVGDGPIIEGSARPQHIDVEVRFWNRRGDPVTVLAVASISLPRRDVELAVSTWYAFGPVTLPPEEGRRRAHLRSSRGMHLTGASRLG